jgi:lysophospholipase L1-like esterase
VPSDLRICFVGDSFIAGAGDPEHLGWVGRIAARSHLAGQSLTSYNLGVRRQTSRDILARWHAECAPRLPVGCDCRVVTSFGVNDTTYEDDVPRIQPEDSAAHLSALLNAIAAAGWDALVVGPPPVSDHQQNQRTARLNSAFSGICSSKVVAYVNVLEPLLASDTWMTEVHEGDGSHPGAGGYQALAELVWPHWLAWSQEPATSQRNSTT